MGPTSQTETVTRDFLPQLSFKNCLPFIMVQNSLSTFLKQLTGHGSKPYACKLLFESYYIQNQFTYPYYCVSAIALPDRAWRALRGDFAKRQKPTSFLVSAQRKGKRKSKNPPHNIILEILTKLPTSTGLPTGRAQQPWNCQGRQETVAFSVFRLAVNLTNTH